MKTQKRWNVIIAVFLLVLAFCFAACAPNRVHVTTASSPQKTDPVEDLTGDLVVRSQFTNKAEEPLIRAFREQFPKVRVQLEPLEPRVDVMSVLTNRAAGTVDAEVILLEQTASPFDPFQAAASGEFLDFSAQYARDSERGSYFPGLFDQMRVRGKRLIFPLQLASQQLLATQSVEEAFATDKGTLAIDELIRWVVSRENSGDAQKPLYLPVYPPYALMMATGQGGVDFDRGEVTIDEAKWKRLMEASRDLIKTYDFTRNYMRAHPNSTSAYADFQTLLMPMRFMPRLLNFSQQMQTEKKTAVFLRLASDQNASTASWLVRFGLIGSGSRNPDLAYRFLQYSANLPFTSEDLRQGIQHDYLRINKQMVLRMIDDLAATETFGGEKIISAANKQWAIDYFEQMYVFVLTSDAALEICFSSMQPYLSGEKPYEACYADMMKRLQDYVANLK